jgi:hypothetical protein
VRSRPVHFDGAVAGDSHVFPPGGSNNRHPVPEGARDPNQACPLGANGYFVYLSSSCCIWLTAWCTLVPTTWR